MLRKKITYTDFNGEQRTEEFCFFLSKADLMKTEIKTTQAGGFKNIIQRMMDAKDYKAMVDLLDELIIKSYGVVSDDGRRLMKGKDGEYAREFMETEAYTELVMELLSGDEAKITEFIEGMLPQQLLEEAKKEMANEKNAPGPVVVDGKATEVKK
jgi:hypothetical protein